MRKILQTLSELDDEQQKDKISEYNNLIAEIGKEKISGESFVNYTLGGAGLIPYVGIGASIVSIILQSLKDLGVKRNIVIKKFEHGKASTSDDVYILDKLSRVAKISIQ